MILQRVSIGEFRRRMRAGLHADGKFLIGVLGLMSGIVAGAAMEASVSVGTALTLLIMASILCAGVKPDTRTYLIPFAAFFLGGAFFLLRAGQVGEADGFTLSDGYTRLDGAEVVAVKYRDPGSIQLTLDPAEEGDGRVLLTVRTGYPESLSVGDRVTVAAMLEVPPGPVVPNGFDYRRYLRFQGVQLTGYAVEPVQVAGHTGSFSASVQNLRASVVTGFRETMSAQGSALAAALFVGRRDYISKDDRETIRNAGLAHILAISGLHMGLVTGALFVVAEIGFACSTFLSNRILPRKAAAIIAWCGGLGYLIISGGAVSTIRAFIMVSVALLAVVLDRRALALRNVGIAALIILALWPEAVFSAGFQMSFAATAGLILFFEKFGHTPIFAGQVNPSFARRLWALFGMSLVTTAVAQVAIGPFALYHFQEVATLGAGANIIVVPLMTFVVMPLGLVCLLLMPLGLHGPVAALLDRVLMVILDIAQDFSVFDDLAVTVPALPGWLLVVVGAGFFLILLFPRKGVVVPAVLASFSLVAVAGSQPAPNILIGKTGYQIAEKTSAETFQAHGLRRVGFVTDNWQQFWGIQREAGFAKLKRACRLRVCSFRLSDGTTIAFPKDLGGLRTACADGAIVIAGRRWRRYCRGQMLFIASENLEKHGPLGLKIQASSSETSTSSGATPEGRKAVDTAPKTASPIRLFWSDGIPEERRRN